MSAVAAEQVRPPGARYEGLLLLLATVCVLGVLVMYVHRNGISDNRDPLTEWQISAFNSLSGADQAIYNALFTAKDDVPYLYEDINMFNKPGEKFRWPSLKDMEESLLPPFYRDKSWEQNGSLKWSLYEPLPEGEMQGSTMYLGTDGTQPQQGSFLLVIGHVHAGFQNTNAMVIWWNAKNHVVMPQSGFRDGLILQGWREVVPLSGAQEVTRIYGVTKESDDAKSADQAEADKAVQDLFGEK